MSKAEELLDSLSIEDIQPFTSQPDIEGHIVIDKDRIIHVPTELKRIAVQYDANIETVTFDCPRYWDEHDLSEMNIYINYKLPGNLINNIGQSLAKNVRINEDDENIINFDWTIGPILTNNKGDLPFSVCAKSKTNQDSDEAIRWYTEINTELTISEGMDGSGDIEDNYEDLFPDIINDIITKLDGINATYDEKLDAFNANATSKTESFDTNAETRTTEFNNNAAQKTLDYNNNCTSKIDSFNQNSTQKVTEFNDNYTSKLNSFNSNADSRIEEFDTHADLALSSIPKQDAEGTDNTFDDGLESPLYVLGGDGKSEQVVTTGKNKLPNSAITSTINGINFTVNKDKSVTLNGTATAQTDFSFLNEKLDLNGEYTFSISDTGQTGVTLQYGVNGAGIMDTGTATTKFTTTFPNKSLASEYSYINMCRVRVASGVTCNNYTIYPMIESGSSKTSYEPYTGGQPSPSPDYPQEINSIEGSLEFACNGRNLLPNSAITSTINGINFTVNKDKSVTLNGTATAQTDFSFLNEKLDLNGEYTFSISDTGQTGVTLQYGVNGAGIMDTGTATTKFTTTFPNKSLASEYSYINMCRVRVASGVTCNNYTIYPMIESGSSKTSYEPYIEPNKVTFNLEQEKLRSVGDVKDELVVDLDTGDYYKVENVGEVVLDGSDDENWSNVPNGTGKNRYTSPIVQNLVYVGTKLCQSNYFKSGTSENYYEDGTIRITPSGGVSIYDDLFTSMDNFKQWLSTNNTIVNYILKKPTTKKLGTLSAEDLAKLKTFKGYNNVTVNTNLGLMNIRFTYGLDIKKYVDNKIAELSAQLIKGE